MATMQPTEKTTYHHGDLRRTLLNVSVDMIDRKGIEALNLRELAILAGVSSGAPYHHFANRAQLLSAIAQEGFELLVASMSEQRDLALNSPSARLEALGNAYVLFATSHRGHFRVMFRVDSTASAVPELSLVAGKAFQMLNDAITECQQAGTAPSGDPQPLVVHAWATVHGLATLLVDGGLTNIAIAPEDLVPLLARLTSQLFDALAKQTAQANDVSQ